MADVITNYYTNSHISLVPHFVTILFVELVISGRYLSTNCLTEFAIYSRMKEEIGSRDEAGMIYFSQFNKIFPTNVTIPKV